MPKYNKITRKQLIEIAKNIGTKQPRQMSNDDLIDTIINTLAKPNHMLIKENLKKYTLNLLKNNILENDLHKVTKPQKSH